MLEQSTFAGLRVIVTKDIPQEHYATDVLFKEFHPLVLLFGRLFFGRDYTRFDVIPAAQRMRYTSAGYQFRDTLFLNPHAYNEIMARTGGVF